jgi:2'-5' RNA ligase
MKKAPYSLWLMPSPTVRGGLAELIDALSRRLGTPRFEPHITLAAPNNATEVNAVTRTTGLAEELAPISIRFEGVGYTDAYFRCLFLRAEKSVELLAAHQFACERLGQPPEAEFMPHLSLVYGTLHQTMKEKLIVEIDPWFPKTLLADRVCLCPIIGPPGAWKLVGPFPLKGKAI